MLPILADCIRPLGRRVVVFRSTPFQSSTLAAPSYQLVIGCWIRKSALMRYLGEHDECHLQAIEEKRGILILDDAFSTNGENSTNCLARPTRDWLLIAARGRNARRTGNFREGERQHVVRGMRAEV